MAQYFIAVDMGTTSTKAVIFDELGNQIQACSEPCSLKTTAQGVAELDPVEIYEAVLKVIKDGVEGSKLPKDEILGIGFSCQMHSLMGIDDQGNPLTKLMTWADTRAINEALEIEKQWDYREIYRRTGCRITHPMYPFAKLMWMRKNEEALFNQVAKWITLKEFVLGKMFDEQVVDYTLASSQGYFDLHTHQWATELLDIVGIHASQLNTPVPCDTPLKAMKGLVADYLGLKRNILGVIGSGDGIMANLGSGVMDSSRLSSTIGTSGAIRTVVAEPYLDPNQQTWCYAFTKDQWVIGGAINNGGLVLTWFWETFKEQFQYDASVRDNSVYGCLDQMASEVEAGSEGLIFLPYLTGERSPDWNGRVRGMIFGLDYAHTRKHFIRGSMEGVMYRLYSVYETMVNQTEGQRVICASGGYIQSDTWLQIQADLFNAEIHVSSVKEAAALGAAMLVMSALGVGSIKKPLPVMDSIRVYIPDSVRTQRYRGIYEKAMKMYDAITSIQPN